MVNYACAFSQSELGKYFEWIIKPFMGLTIIGLYPENLKGKFSRVSSWVSNQRIFVFWFMHVWCNELRRTSFAQSGITWNKIIKYDRASNTKNFLIVDKLTKNIKSSSTLKSIIDKRAARKTNVLIKTNALFLFIAMEGKIMKYVRRSNQNKRDVILSWTNWQISSFLYVKFFCPVNSFSIK